nr:MAG TPA: hypothetical protein [Caudoviricetes sp.]
MARINFENTTTIEDVVYFLRDDCKAESLTALRIILEQDDENLITLLGELWCSNDSDGAMEILKKTVGLAQAYNGHHWEGNELWYLMELSEKYDGKHLFG